jgi:hypothetical protein
MRLVTLLSLLKNKDEFLAGHHKKALVLKYAGDSAVLSFQRSATGTTAHIPGKGRPAVGELRFLLQDANLNPVVENECILVPISNSREFAAVLKIACDFLGWNDSDRLKGCYTNEALQTSADTTLSRGPYRNQS